MLYHVTAAVAENFLELGGFQQLIVARSAHTEYLKVQLSSRKELLVGLSSPHLPVRSKEPCSGFWELLEGAGSGQYHGKGVFFTVIGSLRFIFLITSPIHVLACLLTSLRNILGRNCSWKFSSMSCLGSQGMQSWHWLFSVYGGHLWFTACGRRCWQCLSELQDTWKTGESPLFPLGKIPAGGNERFTLAPFVRACQINV